MEIIEKNLKSIINDVMGLTLQRTYIENRLNGWIDMKIDPSTLEDIYSRNIHYSKEKIYSWIQGRALETISEYLNNLNLTNLNEKSLIACGDILYKKLFDIINNPEFEANKKNIAFVFDSEDESSYYSNFDKPTISDMFVLRGLLSYATERGFSSDYALLTKKLRYIIEISLAGDLINDQFNFTTKKCSNYFTDRIGIEGVMLAIGASQILYNNTKIMDDLLLGLKSIQDITTIFSLKLDDNYYIVDYIDHDKKPWLINNDIVNNPGHCIEIIGLALKFLRLNSASLLNVGDVDITELTTILINMGLSHYDLGKNSNLTIYLQVELISHQVKNSNSPWWSSFETLRMLSEIYYLNESDSIYKLIKAQVDSICDIYLKGVIKNIPLQNVNNKGEVINLIPATPDIDMGYHTSIPSFDVLKVLFSKI